MQKIKIGHRAKFRVRNKYFLQVLFPVRAIYTRFNFRCANFNSFSWRVCLSYGVCRLRPRVQLKTFSSLLNFQCANFESFSWRVCLHARVQLKTHSSLLKDQIDISRVSSHDLYNLGKHTACEYSRPLFAPATTTCETRSQTSAIHRQKFHTDEVNLLALKWHN